MKVAILVLAFIALAAAAPKSNKLHFRNLYKTPIAAPKGKVHPHIIGGQEAEPHSIPYQAFLEVYADFGGWYCGASVISENYVLTAGHCGDGGNQAYVTLGAHAVQENEDSQVQVTTEDITVHEDYDANTVSNDIAVFGLPGGVKFNDAISAATLPSKADATNTYEGATARISGWGLTSDSATEISDVLMYVDVSVISNDKCAETYGDVPETQVCTSGEGNIGSCSGDSGGPLVSDGVQIGVVSYGANVGCEAGYPSGFTRVTSYLDWLAAKTDVPIN